MGAPKTKTPEQLLERRQRVSELYLQCNSMATIGRMLGISATQVYRDICWAREQWRTKAAEAIEQHKQRELAKIDALEVEAIKAWARSCRPVVVQQEKSVLKAGEEGGYEEKSTERRHQAGDPRFLQVIASCIEQRRRILGLDAPIRSEMAVTGNDILAAIAAGQERVRQLAKVSEDQNTGIPERVQ